MDRISVIVACRNEARNIVRFLESLDRQTAAFETVIADGLSDDGTGDVVRDYAGRRAHVRVIDNERRTAASGLNRALSACGGEIVLRMDAHTEYAPDYVGKCAETLERTGASNVGGAARTRADGYFQQAVALAFRSPFFSGGARFHNEAFEGPVDTVPYGCWRRQTLQALNGFDERFVRNQDDELNFRICRSGGLVWQSSSIRSWYYPRRAVGALARQYFEFGFWKVAILRKHGALASWRHFAPAMALSSLLALGAAAMVKPQLASVAGAVVAVYLAAAVVASMACLRAPRQIVFLPALPIVFLTVHASYAAGFLWALIRGVRRPNAVGLPKPSSAA